MSSKYAHLRTGYAPAAHACTHLVCLAVCVQVQLEGQRRHSQWWRRAVGQVGEVAQVTWCSTCIGVSLVVELRAAGAADADGNAGQATMGKPHARWMDRAGGVSPGRSGVRMDLGPCGSVTSTLHQLTCAKAQVAPKRVTHR